jgi:hypothetical protein
MRLWWIKTKEQRDMEKVRDEIIFLFKDEMGNMIRGAVDHKHDQIIEGISDINMSMAKLYANICELEKKYDTLNTYVQGFKDGITVRSGHELRVFDES